MRWYWLPFDSGAGKCRTCLALLFVIMGGLGLSAKFGTMTFATVSDVKGRDGLQSVPQVKMTYRDSEDGDMKLVAEEKGGTSEQEAGTDHATQQRLQLEQHVTRIQPKVAGVPKQVDAQASESQRQEVVNPESRSPQIQLQQETSPDLAADNSQRQEPNMAGTGNEERTAAEGQAGQTKDQEEPLQQQQQQQGFAEEQRRAEEVQNSQADGEAVTELPESPLYSLTAVDIDGQEKSMRDWKGKVLVFVNVASACGYTDSNYKGLVELYKHYKAYGLEILAFPCNQFGGQEPGTLEEIKGFAATYSAGFPMFAKVDVNGPNTHPVYKFLKSSMTPPAPNKEFELSWNFNKFLVDAAGRVVKHYQSDWDHSAMFHDVYDLISFGRLRSLEERLQAGST